MTDQDDYRALREGAAIGAIAPRAQIAVAGRDRASYLQGLLTNDIEGLTAGSGCYSAWLSPQGRMLTDMHVLQSEGMLLLDVPAETALPTLERLDQFLFSEDVRLEALIEAMTGVWIHGPSAASVIEQVVSGVQELGAWVDYQHTNGTFGDEPVSVSRIDQLGAPGYCLHVSRGSEITLVEALRAAGGRLVSADALSAARIEAAYPVFGVDMTEDTIPLEAGIEQRAISMTKGCYVGQEIIIRVLHRGGGRVAKRLVPLRLEAAAAAGAKLFSGERDIGVLTSVADSPRYGTIALGYVHRDFTAVGTQVDFATSEGRAGGFVTVPLTSTS